jgi:hypothetical protein
VFALWPNTGLYIEPTEPIATPSSISQHMVLVYQRFWASTLVRSCSWIIQFAQYSVDAKLMHN